MRKSAALAAAILAAGTGVVSAQIGARSQATFRSEINYVEVDVVVTDAQGRFVPGLTAGDFELVDDGKAQKIEVFHEVDLPLERADRPMFAAGTVPPDIASNVSIANGRVYLLLLDDLHTTPSNTNLVKHRAREFVETYMGSNDLAAVLHTSGRTNVSQDFTSNRSLLLEAIDGFMGRGLNSAVLNRVEEFNTRRAAESVRGTPVPMEAARDRDARERLTAARGTFLAVRDLANYLASLSGRRKALLLFSEGVDIDSDTLRSLEAQSTYGDVQEAREAMLEGIASATRANVHVYTIDASAMAGSFAGADIAALPRGDSAEEQGLTSLAIANERRRAQGTLRTIAAQTGGIPIVNTNSFAEGFSRIQRENSTYYLLGFYPTTARDGRFHRLQVRARKPGLQVRARAGYHATRPTAASAPAKPTGDELRDLLTAAIPTAGLPMTVALAPFKHTSGQAMMLMAIDLSKDAFRFEMDGAVAAEDLEFVYQVIDPGAKVVTSTAQMIEMRLRQATRDLVDERGFRAIFPVNIKPGRYQVRVAARTKNAGRRGSVFADLVVPDFLAPALVWSGVSLASDAALQVPTRAADMDPSILIPVMPAAVRAFDASDSLTIYAEAYDNDTRGAHDVDVTATVRDEGGKVVFTTTETRSSAELAGGRGGYGLHARIPLRNLPPGPYVLTLTARSRAAGNATAARDIPFAIS